MFLQHPWVLIAYIPIAVAIVWLVKKNFVQFKHGKEMTEYEQKMKKPRRWFILSRLLIFLFLFIALATPAVIKEVPVEGDPIITILADNSTSFDLFDTALAGSLKGQLDKYVPTTIKYIATGERSAIGDGVLNNMKGDDNLLIISDGNNNFGKPLGEILLLAANLNTTVNAVKLKPKRDDTAVSISGPAQGIIGSDTTFYVDVMQVGSQKDYYLSVEVDGVTVLEDQSSGAKTFTFTQRLGEGYHTVKADILIDDYFKQNNVYYKSFKVVPKPDILFVTKKTSLLGDELEKIYDVTISDFMPATLPYAAVVINDLSASEISPFTDQMIDYVTEGGGLLVIGGQNAYTEGNYKDSVFETLLPVISGEGERKQDERINIIIVIDISGSTGGGPVDIEKAQAIAILDDLKGDDSVGVVAFNAEAFTIAYPAKLKEKKEEMRSKIASLKDGGGTHVETGIERATELLQGAQGSKTIILISDGHTKDEGGSLKAIKGAGFAGIKTYVVGIGEGTNDRFMESASVYGGGAYFKPAETEKIKILFGEPDEEEKDQKNIVVLNSNHFITSNLNMSGALAGFNIAVPKTSANMLVSTGQGAPILTVWRFGLGKVASITTDDGTGWGGVLLSEKNSKMWTKTINWVIGDPEKNLPYSIRTFDTSVDKPTTIVLRSSSDPVSSQLKFYKTDENIYEAEFIPEKPGFFSFLDSVVAVNDNSEYAKIGLNPELESLVTITGGEMFEEDDIENMLKKAVVASKRLESRSVPVRWPFMLLALLLFLGEICVRRVFG